VQIGAMNVRRSALLTGVLLSVALQACSPEPGTTGEPGGDIDACTVAHLSDGDTVICVERNERVRLLLIDAPEMAQQPWGDSARAALEALIPEGRTARLEYDVERRDIYGRLLAYLWLPDGRMVNEEMARGGYVVLLHYPPNSLHLERIRSAVAEAAGAHRGLWATPAFDCLPVDFRAGRCTGA